MKKLLPKIFKKYENEDFSFTFQNNEGFCLDSFLEKASVEVEEDVQILMVDCHHVTR
jgi:hypothetical protein